MKNLLHFFTVTIIFLIGFTNLITAQNSIHSTGLCPINKENYQTISYSFQKNNVDQIFGYGSNALSSSSSWVSFPLQDATSITVISNLTNWFQGGDFAGDGFFYGVDYNTKELIKVDPTTGTCTSIASISGGAEYYTITSLGYNPVSSIMYLGATDGSSNSRLYTIDLTTGVTTLIGNINCPLLITLAVNNEGSIYGVDIATDKLLSIDPITGAGTEIGSIGFDLNYAQDADFDPSTDSLYLAAYDNTGPMLLSIDINTGAAKLVTSWGSNIEITAFGINYPYPVSVKSESIVVNEFSLSQNYPNPFNPSTKISWQSPVGSHQTLKVYDILGNEVAILVDEYREAGKYEINFDASNLVSGVYIYKIIAGGFISSKKMLLMK